MTSKTSKPAVKTCKRCGKELRDNGIYGYCSALCYNGAVNAKVARVLSRTKPK